MGCGDPDSCRSRGPAEDGEYQNATGLAPRPLGDLATITVLAVLLGFIKCRMIIRAFMEVRHAPSWLRHGTDGWLVVLWVSVLAIYLW